MSLIDALIVLVVVGVVLYLIETYVPMAPGFKIVIRVVAILLLCLYLLRLAGLTGRFAFP